MFKSPYQTSVFSSYQFKKTGGEIRRLEIDGELVNINPEGTIKATPLSAVNFPPFNMMVTKEEIPTLETDIVLDGRHLLRPNGAPQKPETYEFFQVASELTRRWLTETGPGEVLSYGGDFAVKMYGLWLSSGLSRRLALDFGQTLKLQAMASIYYQQLHGALDNKGDNTGQGIDRLLNRTARTLPGIDAHSLLQMLDDDIPVLENNQDFVDWVKSVMNSPRVDVLTTKFLYLELGSAWWPQYRDMTLSAIEFPPTFLAMVYMSVKHRSFTKTRMGEMIKNRARTNETKPFLTAVNQLLTN